ncbi:hypothetical protein CANMA_001515 [Candida margitis]|uniref:uncharacterized protein n=1 Tax=Candida margitis TaxID=1775924 RepID=UPI002227F8FE|nr:uncharacterized protein CANMA_001515 [Candida margitis]KAI5969447.1 hypothetical protein CANMA_001515 [Candida margitis]
MSGSDTALLILLIITLSLTVFTLLMITSLTDPYWYLHILPFTPRYIKKVRSQRMSSIDLDLEQQSISNVDESGSHNSTTNGSNIALDSYPMGSSVSERNNNVHGNQLSGNESAEVASDSSSNIGSHCETAAPIPQTPVVRNIPATADDTYESIGGFGSTSEEVGGMERRQTLDYGSAMNLSRFEVIGTSTDAVLTNEDGNEVLHQTIDESQVANPTIIAHPATSTSVFDSAQIQSTPSTLLLEEETNEGVKKKANTELIREAADQLSDNFIRIGDLVIVIRPFVGAKKSDFSLLQPGDLIRVNKFYVVDQDLECGTPLKSKSSKLAEQNSIIPKGVIGLENLSNSSSEDDSSSEDGQTQEMTVTKTDAIYNKLYCTGLLLSTYLKESTSQELIWRQRERSDATDVNSSTRDFPLNVVTLEETLIRGTSRK